MPKDAAEWAANEFDKLESIRSNTSFRGTDRRASAPLISGKTYTNISHVRANQYYYSGDTFRSVAPFLL